MRPGHGRHAGTRSGPRRLCMASRTLRPVHVHGDDTGGPDTGGHESEPRLFGSALADPAASTTQIDAGIMISTPAGGTTRRESW